MWQPLASRQTLIQRASLLQKIRAYFDRESVIEVEVPVIGERGVTDLHVDALELEISAKEHYLQTSPEYFMKRLLAAGLGDIYYLGKAFRRDQPGRIHHHEFTMLEWYRLGFNDQSLIDDVFQLIAFLKPDVPTTKFSYEQVFQQHVGLNPHTASVNELKQRAHESLDLSWDDDDRSTWLDLLFSHLVEANLPQGLCAIYDYPACQSALAKLGNSESGQTVAKRFECFYSGVELANGYWELTDPSEQLKRFELDNQLRGLANKKKMALDTDFLAAVEHGLPECAGVALGIDRLVMALLELPSIERQRSF